MDHWTSGQVARRLRSLSIPLCLPFLPCEIPPTRSPMPLHPPPHLHLTSTSTHSLTTPLSTSSHSAGTVTFHPSFLFHRHYQHILLVFSHPLHFIFGCSHPQRHIAASSLHLQCPSSLVLP